MARTDKTGRTKPPTSTVIAEVPEFGGARTYLLTLISWLRTLGFSVSLNVGRDVLHDRDLRSTLRDCGGEVRVLPQWTGSAVFRFLRLEYLAEVVARRLVARRRPRETLRIISVATPLQFWGLLLRRVPCIYVLHTIPADTSQWGGGRMRTTVRRLRERLWALRIRSALDRGTIVLTVSRFSAEEVARLWLKGRRHRNLRYLYNTVSGLDQELSPLSSCRVATLGHLVWYKQPRLWLQIARAVQRRLPQAVFIWGGDGELRDALEEATKREGVKGIRFAGLVSDVSSFLRDAAVYVQPSLIESHGISVLEAMAHGVPCVVSSAGGLPESVDDGVTGFVVDPGNVDGFADAVTSLLANRELRLSMGRAGRSKFENEFSVSVWETKMETLLSELGIRSRGTTVSKV